MNFDKNFPFTQISNKGVIKGTMHTNILKKAINQLPEHTSITALKTTLINALVASNASINNTFVNIVDSNYVKMHQHLMGETAAFSSQAGYNYKAYQGDFIGQSGTLKMQDIKIRVVLKEAEHVELGGLETFVIGTEIPDKFLSFNLLATQRKFGTLLVIKGYESFDIKFEIANESNYFASSQYLKRPNFGKFTIWRPLLGTNNEITSGEFAVRDVLMQPLS